MKVAINGFGRIGRLAFRKMLEKGIDVVAINDLTTIEMLAHLLKYDTAHGRFDAEISFDESHLIVNGTKIKFYSERDAQNLPWGELNVDVVAECTGFYRTRDRAMLHVEAGAKKVVISAPATADIKTVVIGVNEDTITEDDIILSNASCTTNCLAPMAKILHENIGIESGFLNTVHAYTGDQRLQDAPHSKDMRRARAAAESIIPTSTGAAKAVGWVLPELKGKLDGMATRVPVITGSLTDFTVVLQRKTTIEEINSLFQKAAESMQGVLQYTEDALVSSDIKSSPYSCILQGDLTKVQGKTAKIIAWYDNEMGYASRLVDLIGRI